MSLAQPITYSVISGALPAGVTLDDSGFITGVPSVVGPYSFVIQATGSDGHSTARAYSINVGGIDNSPLLPDAASGEDYAVFFTQTGMTEPVTWAIVAVPAGLSLDSASGLLDGTPTESGDFAFTVVATNGDQSCEKSFSLTVTSVAFCGDMVWGAPLIIPSTPVAGTGSATASECTFHVEATVPALALTNQVVEIIGSQSYTGPAINLNLHLVISGMTGNMGNGDIAIELDGNPLVSITNEDVDGTYDYPFTIPISVAANFTIQCLMIPNSSAGAAGGVWDGVISVLP